MKGTEEDLKWGYNGG